MPTFKERMNAARTFRVFPGEGVHSDELARLVVELDRLGYGGNYSLEVFNGDCQQLPLPLVAERARRAAVWLAEDVLRRALPLCAQMKLRDSVAAVFSAAASPPGPARSPPSRSSSTGCSA